MPSRTLTYTATCVFASLILISGCSDMKAAKGVYEPKETRLAAGEKYILTPKESARPRINGPKAFGVRPGSPFLFTIAASGKRPMTFTAENLPEELSLDPKTGRISGVIKIGGVYNATVTATNSAGSAQRRLQIAVGEHIALTPPMGWNSWNCWADQVSDEHIRQSAKGMVDSGLINHGWTYINIDDAWQSPRGGPLNAIQGNEKFPDMKGLCDYTHSLGLKVGIYSTPWITSYAGYIGGSSDNEDGAWEKVSGYNNYSKNHRHGKFPFADNDARQWAAWGIDYLKYDWNPNDPEHVEQMAKALRASGRDIVYSLSNSAPFEHAALWTKLANCWRTTGDIRDAWAKDKLPPSEKWAFGVTDIWRLHGKWAPFNGPGHWNDADMLVVGRVGWGKPHPTNLTPDEQYTHISLWCLWSAPLLLGCPLDQLDPFTINLLTNDEVLAINQDPLGLQAVEVAAEGSGKVLAKKLEDGSIAAGFFNVSEQNLAVRATWQQLGVSGSQAVRDLWRQKNIGTYDGEFSAVVRPHGVILVNLTSSPK